MASSVPKITKAQKTAVMSELGRKGGKARARKMTKEERTEHGRMAVEARWSKVRKKPVPVVV